MPPNRASSLVGSTACGAVLALAACGGGGGDDGSSPPPSSALFVDASATHLPPGAGDGACMDAQALDFDGDGDLDLVLAIEFGINLVLSNDGTGHFAVASAGMLATGADHEDIALADLDGDGDLDLAFAAEDTQVHELYLDQGASFLGAQLGPTSEANAVVAFDLDADGDLDLVFGGQGLLVLLNDGSAGFSVDAPGRFPAEAGVVQDLVAIDVDGDADLDLALGNEGQNQLFLNQGGGAFSDATATHLPAVIDETRVLAFADVDRDGDLDLFVGNVHQEMVGAAGQDFLYANDGRGVFAALPALPAPGGFGTYGGRFVDFDVDGDPDLVTGSADILDATDLGSFRLYRNDGTGLLVDISDLAFGAEVREHGFGVAAGDLDGDLDIDLYLCSRGASAGGVRYGHADHLMLQR